MFRLFNHFFLTFGRLAFVPLDEFSDRCITKRYGVFPDKETLEILHLVANQKGVCLNSFSPIYLIKCFYASSMVHFMNWECFHAGRSCCQDILG